MIGHNLCSLFRLWFKTYCKACCHRSLGPPYHNGICCNHHHRRRTDQTHTWFRSMYMLN